MRIALSSLLLSFVLMFLAVALAGGGHGVMLPLLLISAPLPMGTLGYAIFALSPLMWALFGYLAMRGPRLTFPILVSAHYVAFLLSYFFLYFEDDLLHPHRSSLIDREDWVAFGVLLLIYLGLQSLLWASWSVTPRRQMVGETGE